MALPENVSTGVVTGTVLAFDGTPARGSVRFTAEASYALDAEANVVLVALSRTVRLDSAGQFSIELAATDDDDLVPADFTYRVRPMIDGLPLAAFSMSVPSGSEQDLADVAPAPGSGGTLPEGDLDPAVADLVPGPSLTHDALVDLIADEAGSVGAVASVNGETGVVVLDKGDIGLSNVDNTSDANKPVSTATATALAGKSATGHVHSASDVTAGTLAVSRIGSGTAAAGKYVDGGTGAWTELPDSAPITDFGGGLYPISEYGFFATSIRPEGVTGPAALDPCWSVRIPVPAGQAITRAGVLVTAAGVGVTGLASFAVYDDDGDLITSTVSDASVFETAGYRFKDFPSPVASEGTDRFVWLRANIEAASTSRPFVAFWSSSIANSLDGGLTTHRRCYFSGNLSSWASTIDPLTDGSANGGYIPLMGLG